MSSKVETSPRGGEAERGSHEQLLPSQKCLELVSAVTRVPHSFSGLDYNVESISETVTDMECVT